MRYGPNQSHSPEFYWECIFPISTRKVKVRTSGSKYLNQLKEIDSNNWTQLQKVKIQKLIISSQCTGANKVWSRDETN